MVILITGANGQLGNEMRRVSAQSSNRYIFTDVAELDITDREAVLAYVEAEKVEVIVNCAAYTNVEKAEEDYERADLLNNRAVENLALAARAAHSPAWSKGSPPERVSPSVRGLDSICSASSSTVTARPPAGSWVSGLWQPGQRQGQPERLMARVTSSGISWNTTPVFTYFSMAFFRLLSFRMGHSACSPAPALA